MSDFLPTEFYYLIAQDELDSVEKDKFKEIYPLAHPLSRMYSTSRNKIHFAISRREMRDVSGYAGRWDGVHNPIKHEPNLTAKYLTHYILSKTNDAIIGHVYFDRSIGGDYVGTMLDGTEVVRTMGQTSYCTQKEIEKYERYDNWSSDKYLYRLQMMYLSYCEE